MEDEKGPDAKVLTVPVGDPVSGRMFSLEDLEPEQRKEIEHFFTIYKDLEPGKRTSTRGWSGAEEARAAIEDARLRAENAAGNH
jgi:inorganic pyrophosphatase